jgi:hypothetical protein
MTNNGPGRDEPALVVPDNDPLLHALRTAHSQHWAELPFEEIVLRALRIGAKVLLTSKRPRRRSKEVGDLIERTYTALRKKNGREPTAQDVMIELPRYDDTRILDRVSYEVISWLDARGHEHTMRLSTLRNRLRPLRAKGVSAKVHQ